MSKRLKVFPGFLTLVIFSFALYFLMIHIQHINISNEFLFSYQALEEKTQFHFLYKIFWFIGDMTEAQFYKSTLAAIGLLLFALIAHSLYRRGSKWAGFHISYGTGLWPWVFAASTIGLFISMSLYIHHLPQGWIPTFVAFVSIPAGVVLLYGGGWRNTLTGAILGGLLAFPISWFFIRIILAPLELPGVIGSVTGMWLGAIIVFEICHYLPWMKIPNNSAKETKKEVAATEMEVGNISTQQVNIWYVRRVFADLTEPQFYGNEIATIGLLLGAFIGWLLNPTNPFYGSGLFPALIFSQIIVLAMSNFFYFNYWKKLGWFPTFVPVVSVAPTVVQIFDGSILIILIGAFLGALIGPPIAQTVNRKIPNHWHPVVGNTFSMALSTLIVVEVLMMIFS